jgi:hypothetical protein
MYHLPCALLIIRVTFPQSSHPRSQVLLASSTYSCPSLRRGLSSPWPVYAQAQPQLSRTLVVDRRPCLDLFRLVIIHSHHVLKRLRGVYLHRDLVVVWRQEFGGLVVQQICVRLLIVRLCLLWLKFRTLAVCCARVGVFVNRKCVCIPNWSQLRRTPISFLPSRRDIMSFSAQGNND